uniref:Uncharacterized protein n=1 Tax=Panagrolaimus superbus TaxID=310955 RepID=A0A914YHI4_9BILA
MKGKLIIAEEKEKMLKDEFNAYKDQMKVKQGEYQTRFNKIMELAGRNEEKDIEYLGKMNPGPSNGRKRHRSFSSSSSSSRKAKKTKAASPSRRTDDSDTQRVLDIIVNMDNWKAFAKQHGKDQNTPCFLLSTYLWWVAELNGRGKESYNQRFKPSGGRHHNSFLVREEQFFKNNPEIKKAQKITKPKKK